MRMEVVPLGEVATITAGQSPPGNTYNENGIGLPFFQGKADFGELHPIARKWCVAPRKIAEGGDILISVRAPVGPTNVAGERCCIGRGLAAVRPDETIALRDFVLWNIKYRQPELVAKGQGSTFAAIGQRDLKSLLISLPPLDEQRRIVGILNRAAKIERLRSRTEERLREFVPALFVRMFGDPVENPMGWEVRPFGELVGEFRYGTSKKCGAETLGRDVAVLRIPNVLGDVIDWTGLKFAALDAREAKPVLLKDGDILIVRTNGNPEYVGRCAVFRSSRQTAYASYLIRARLRPSSAVSSEYVASVLGTAGMRQTVLQLARTTAGNHNINIAGLSRLPIPIPPIDLQCQYSRILGASRSMAAVAASGSRLISEIGASLMQRMLGGVELGA